MKANSDWFHKVYSQIYSSTITLSQSGKESEMHSSPNIGLIAISHRNQSKNGIVKLTLGYVYNTSLYTETTLLLIHNILKAKGPSCTIFTNYIFCSNAEVICHFTFFPQSANYITVQ